MISNEQRAHDVAISLLPKIFEYSILSDVNQGKTDITFNAYSLYTETYTSLLKSFNQDYPDGF